MSVLAFVAVRGLEDQTCSNETAELTKKAAETELNFFLEFFEERTIQNLLFNESNGFHLHKKM